MPIQKSNSLLAGWPVDGAIGPSSTIANPRVGVWLIPGKPDRDLLDSGSGVNNACLKVTRASLPSNCDGRDFG
jgi:hypothetical protein